MKLLLIKFSIFFTFILCLTSELAAKKLEAYYVIEFGAINIGAVKWEIEIDNDTYLTSISLKDKGLFSGLYRFTGEYLSEGKILKNEFISTKYKQIWKTKKKKREVEILFDKAMVFALVLKPKEKEIPRVDYLKIQGLVDPLSSFLNILLNSNNNFKTIDGRRLYKMSLAFKKTDGNIISKKIYLKDYLNIWADHRRNDLEFIIIEQDLSKEGGFFFPNKIKIKNKGLVFKLTKV